MLTQLAGLQVGERETSAVSLARARRLTLRIDPGERADEDHWAARDVAARKGLHVEVRILLSHQRRESLSHRTRRHRLLPGHAIAQRIDHQCLHR